MRPRSPYGASKAAARQLVKVYRESYNLFAIQGWLFNHEGIRRGHEFVSRKITLKVAEIYNNIKNGNKITPLELGTLHAKRDWSDAEDMIDAIWLMLNNNNPMEYVVSSDETHSIREFVEIAFNSLGILGEWYETGLDEYYYYKSGPKPLPSSDCKLVKINPDFYRPAEVDRLCGNSSKIRKELGWIPKTTFKQLVIKMVENDIKN